MEKFALKFIMTLHDHNSLTRSQVEDIVNYVTEFLSSGLVSSMQLYLKPNVSSEGIPVMESILRFCKSPFATFKTEHRLINFLEKELLYKKPKQIIVDSSNLIDNININESKVVIVDMKFNFSMFLQNGNLLSRMIEYMNHLEHQTDGVMSNYIHGNSWKLKKLNFVGKLAIPFWIYVDDYEINNPLGSHAGSHAIAATYAQFLCLPPECASSTDSIIPVMYFKTKEKKIEHS